MACFGQRFSAKRLHEVVEKKLDAHKRGLVLNSGFGDLLRIAPFSVPNALVEWVVMQINPKLREFRFRNKSILFTKEIVQKVIGVPSGDRPVELLSRTAHSDLRNMYRVGDRAPIAKAINVLESEQDDVIVKRTFILLALATVLCPGGGNMVPLEYLASLADMDRVHEFAWDEHILDNVMKNVTKFQEKKDNKAVGFCIGGFLPLLVIIYMDHLDFPPSRANEHAINYSLPRACFVCNTDFEFVVANDKNKLVLNTVSFGKRPFREFSKTPYVEARAQEPANDEYDWLRQSLPISQHFGVPEHLKSLYDKHKQIYAQEVDGALQTFGQMLKTIHSSRMAALLSDVHSAAVPTSFITAAPGEGRSSVPAQGEGASNATAQGESRLIMGTQGKEVKFHN